MYCVGMRRKLLIENILKLFIKVAVDTLHQARSKGVMSTARGDLCKKFTAIPYVVFKNINFFVDFYYFLIYTFIRKAGHLSDGF